MMKTMRLTVRLGQQSCRSLVYSRPEAELDSSRLTIQRSKTLRAKPDHTKVPFGQAGCSDHMLTVRWEAGRGWDEPTITPLAGITLDPCSKVLHYAQEVFEGMKGFRGVDGRVRLFRPDLNMERMNQSASRAHLPSFAPDQLLECIRRLILVDESWIPHSTSSSLYIRPAMIGTEGALGLAPSREALLFVVMTPVASYYSTGAPRPVSLLCNPDYVRAFPGGAGDTKLGSNYAPTFVVQGAAAREGCDQVLWVQGEDRALAEVGAMNIFLVLRGPGGKKTLVTPALDGTVLPGVTRRSVIDMMRASTHVDTVEERKITLDEVLTAQKEERLLEVFGTGTAVVVSPVGMLRYDGTNHQIPTPLDGVAMRVLQQLTNIYYGQTQHPWAMAVDQEEVHHGILSTANEKRASDVEEIELESLQCEYIMAE